MGRIRLAVVMGVAAAVHVHIDVDGDVRLRAAVLNAFDHRGAGNGRAVRLLAGNNHVGVLAAAAVVAAAACGLLHRNMGAGVIGHALGVLLAFVFVQHVVAYDLVFVGGDGGAALLGGCVNALLVCHGNLAVDGGGI